MSDPKNEDLTNQPVPSPTWKPEPQEMDMDPQPLPEQADDTPPARSGQSERAEKQTESASNDNPVHHTGRVPPKVTPGEL